MIMTSLVVANIPFLEAYSSAWTDEMNFKFYQTTASHSIYFWENRSQNNRVYLNLCWLAVAFVIAEISRFYHCFYVTLLNKLTTVR